MDRTTFQQTLPIPINASYFDSDLLTAPKMLKNFVCQYHHKREIFELQKRHTITDSEIPNKNLFLINFTIDIFLFVTALISLLVTT